MEKIIKSFEEFNIVDEKAPQIRKDKDVDELTDIRFKLYAIGNRLGNRTQAGAEYQKNVEKAVKQIDNLISILNRLKLSIGEEK